jgi:hypothetical protein
MPNSLCSTWCRRTSFPSSARCRAARSSPHRELAASRNPSIRPGVWAVEDITQAWRGGRDGSMRVTPRKRCCVLCDEPVDIEEESGRQETCDRTRYLQKPPHRVDVTFRIGHQSRVVRERRGESAYVGPARLRLVALSRIVEANSLASAVRDRYKFGVASSCGVASS